MLFILAKKFFSIKVANITLALTSFWPSILIWSTSGMKEPLSIFLITLNVFIYLNYFKDSINNLGFVLLLLISVVSNYAISLILIIIFCLFRICKKDNFKFSLYNKLILPLLGLIIIRFSFDSVRLLRSHLFPILFFSFLLSRIISLNKKALISLLILVCLGLFYFSSANKFNIKEFYNRSTHVLIDHQSNQQQSARTAYKIYPDKYYASKLNISFPDLVFSYLKGLSYILFSPFPFRGFFNSSNLLALVQSIIFYLLVPFTTLGIFISLRYKWRDMSIFIFFIFFTLSLYALVEGNIGTLFRHRDVATFFLLMFTAIGIDRLFEFSLLKEVLKYK